MLQQILITLGAGVVSSVFFFIPVKGSVLALFVGVFAPLPLMIVAFGYGQRSAAISTFVGALLVAVLLHSWLAVTFLLSVALPALALTYVASVAAPAPAPFAIGRLLLWIVGLAILLDCLGIFAVGLRYPSFDAALDDLATRFAPMVEAVFERANGPPGGTTAKDFAATLVFAMAPVMAVWGVFALAINLWLAGRVVQISGRLSRPWPDVAAEVGLPRAAMMIFAIAFALTLTPGALRVFAATAAAGVAAGLALQGLAILHWRTRGNPGRAGILAAAYGASLFLFPWPLLLLAALGFADLALPSRLRQRPQPPFIGKP